MERPSEQGNPISPPAPGGGRPPHAPRRFTLPGPPLLGRGLLRGGGPRSSPRHPPAGGAAAPRKATAPTAATAPAAPTASGIPFAGGQLPDEAGSTHVAVIGGTNSGKTTALRLLMQAVLPDVARLPGRRALLTDVKQDVVPLLLGMGIPEGFVVISNPTDSRAREWSICEDCGEPDVAFQLATILVPEENGHNRYFTDAARDLLFAIMCTFQQTAEGRFWGLADVMTVLSDLPTLRRVLDRSEEGRMAAGKHLSGPDITVNGILSTLWTRMSPLATLAWQWRRAGERNGRFSITGFLAGNGILVLGHSQQAKAPIMALNRALINRTIELLLDKPEVPPPTPRVPRADQEAPAEQRQPPPDRRGGGGERGADTSGPGPAGGPAGSAPPSLPPPPPPPPDRTWFILDELRMLGRLDALPDLLTNGRSKGGAAVLAFQSVAGLRHVYGGPEVVDELLGQCNNVLALKTLCPATRRWLSDFFDAREMKERSYQNSINVGGKDGPTRTYGSQAALRERRVVLPIELMELPLLRAGGTWVGYCYSPYAGGTYRMRLSADAVFSQLLPPAPVPSRVPVPVEDKKSAPWSPADEARLGLLPPGPDASSAGRAGGEAGDAPPAATAGSEGSGGNGTPPGPATGTGTGAAPGPSPAPDWMDRFADALVSALQRAMTALPEGTPRRPPAAGRSDGSGADGSGVGKASGRRPPRPVEAREAGNDPGTDVCTDADDGSVPRPGEPAVTPASGASSRSRRRPRAFNPVTPPPPTPAADAPQVAEKSPTYGGGTPTLGPTP